MSNFFCFQETEKEKTHIHTKDSIGYLLILKLTLNNSRFCPKRLGFMDFLDKNNLKSVFT